MHCQVYGFFKFAEIINNFQADFSIILDILKKERQTDRYCH